MKGLAISEVASQIGVRPSTIRYYEQIGILLPPQRVGGKRHYDESILARLAVIQRARQTGFSLKEIRQLFFGFRPGVPSSERWKKMSAKKLAELSRTMERIKTMQELLQRMQNCHCKGLEECGEKILLNQKKRID
jgi:MerR family transcriptional regulator, redox-sensitive transcriptional activator SoxR